MTRATAQPAQVSTSLAARLYARAQKSAPHSGDWKGAGAFAAALERSVAGRFREEKKPPSPAEVESYLESLQLGDLALACACAEGHDAAWEHFVRAYRQDLYAAARAVAKDANPHELADSIYAELFGLEEKDGKRRSLFAYFHGRSKLSTWLRAIVAQRFVDQVRAAKRTVSLDAESELSEGRAGAPPFPTSSVGKGGPGLVDEQDCDRGRLLHVLQSVLQAVLQALEPRDRLRLSYYYVQDLTLAQIGRLLGEHEATVSRKLDRTRADLRKQIERTLREEKRLSDAQVQLCLEYAREEWPFDLSESLAKRP